MAKTKALISCVVTAQLICVFRDLEDAIFGVPGRENLGSDAYFCQEMIPGTKDFFTVRRPKIPIFTLALLFISSKNQLSNQDRDYSK